MKSDDLPTKTDHGTETWSSADVATPQPPGSSSPSLDARLSRIESSHYDFDDVVGRGGVGVVVRARDRRLGRTVAIKLVAARDAVMHARFEREALLTARLQHPGIVPIYEAGTWPNGESFYAMRLIEGRPLAELIDDCTSLDDRLALVPKVVAICEAIAYAHTQRVIHRDIKPRNVVVGPFGEVMVVDWGLAKDLAAPDAGDRGGVASPGPPGETVDGAVLGTPAYMPPEQASGVAVDERADVYAIGALLYHLLTGAPPYSATTSAEILRQVQQDTPPAVEVRQPGVPRDLAAIVGKAMQRDPAARYANAGELAGDIKRFVTGQLVGAHHYSRPVLVARAIRRHPVITAVALALVALVVLGAIALRRIANEQAATERRSRELLLGQARALVETDPTAAVALLARAPDAPADRATVRAIALDAESRGVARHVLVGHGGPLRQVAVAPDGAHIASTDFEGALYLWDAATGRGEALHRSTTLMHAVEFDATGAYLAAALGPARGVLLWDRRARTKRVLETLDEDCYTIAFSPDGALLVGGGSGGRVYVWTTATGERRVLEGHEGWVATVAYAPDGQRVLSVSQEGSARLWTVATGQAAIAKLDDQGYVGVFSRDGRKLAVGEVSGALRVYATDDLAAPPTILRGDAGAVDYVAFAPDGAQIAWGGAGEAVYVADLATSKVRALHGHTDDITGMSFLADGTLVTASTDGTLRRWDIATRLGTALRGHTDQIVGLAVAPGDRFVVSASADRTLRVWPIAAAPRTIAGKASKDSLFHATAAGDALVFHQEGQILTHVDVATGAARTITTAQPRTRMALHPAGTLLAYRDPGRMVHLVDLATGREHDLGAPAPLTGRALAFSPDGATLLFSGKQGMWAADVATRAVHELPFPGGPLADADVKVNHVQFAADGKRALSVSKDLVVWDLAARSGRGVAPPPAPIQWPSNVVGSADLRTLAAGGVGGLALYDGAAWRLLHASPGEVSPIVFSRDGRLLVAADDTGTIRLWRLGAPSAPPAVLTGHVGPVRRLELSADGTRLLSGGVDGAVRVWDVASGAQLVALRGHGGRAVEWVGFRGQEIVSAGRDGAVRVWPAIARAPGANRALLGELVGRPPQGE